MVIDKNPAQSPAQPVQSNEQLVAFAVEQLAAGLSNADVRTELCHKGVPDETVLSVVDQAAKLHRRANLPARRSKGWKFIGIGLLICIGSGFLQPAFTFVVSFFGTCLFIGGLIILIRNIR